jgi:hypothetical protein
MLLSKRIDRELFGKHDGFRNKAVLLRTMTHPDGTEIKWRGDDGLIFTLFWRIQKLESEVEELKRIKSK